MTLVAVVIEVITEAVSRESPLYFSPSTVYVPPAVRVTSFVSESYVTQMKFPGVMCLRVVTDFVTSDSSPSYFAEISFQVPIKFPPASSICFLAVLRHPAAERHEQSPRRSAKRRKPDVSLMMPPRVDPAPIDVQLRHKVANPQHDHKCPPGWPRATQCYRIHNLVKSSVTREAFWRSGPPMFVGRVAREKQIAASRQRGHDVSAGPGTVERLFLGPRVTTFLVPKLPLGNASCEAS